jgi:hypothetical protein
MGLDYVEFVLGVQQVVKGFDRGLQRMSIGTYNACYPSSREPICGYATQSWETIADTFLLIMCLRYCSHANTSGQRAVITCTPEYGYGIDGLFPLVPPNAHLLFDVTLLGFRPRPIWVKTLIQVQTS